MSAIRSYTSALAVLSLMGLALGCGAAEPTRTLIDTTPPSPTMPATSTPVPPTAVPTALPSTAVPAPGVTPTPQPPIEGTVAPATAPTVDTAHRPEPTSDPIAETPVVRVTTAPAETNTPAPTPTPTPTPPPAAPADVIIECIYFDGLVRTTEADEFVQVLNQGANAVDLSGWRLVDQSDGSPEFTFPAYALEAQATVRVYTNEDHPESGGFSFQRKSSIWNNSDPDTAALINPSGAVVSTKTYPPGC